MRQILSAVVLTSGLVLGTGAQAATAVDLELLLLTDVSGSVDDADFALYRDGYEAAFRSASVIDTIAAGALGRIAVAIGFWADSQVLGTAWTMISDSASSNAFADTISGLSKPGSIGTSTGMAVAVNWGAGLFGTNNFDGTRQVIDVAADGADSVSCNFADQNCTPLRNARDAALASGVDTINGLFIQDRNFFGNQPGNIVDAIAYGNSNLIGGNGAFLAFVSGFDAFPAAIEAKLAREIPPPPPPIPVPAALPLLASALGLLGLIRRRARTA